MTFIYLQFLCPHTMHFTVSLKEVLYAVDVNF